MPSLALAIALQQQSATMAQEHQAAFHQLENARLAAERLNPPKFNGGEKGRSVDERH